jgi:hypothetical protein
MRSFNKKLTGTAAAVALMAGLGAAFAQSDAKMDPNDTPMVTEDASTGAHILSFKDQGNSPESDPAAHLILIKDQPAKTAQAPVVSDNTAVADSTPAPAPMDTTPAPAVDNSSTTSSTDTTTAAPVDAAPMPAPRADRN